MIGKILLTTIFLAVFASAGWNGQNVQRGSGIKLASTPKNGTSARGSGLKLNFSGRGGGSRSTPSPELNQSTPGAAPTPPQEFYSGQHHSTNLHVGLVVPYKTFGAREYSKALTTAKSGLSRKLPKLFRRYDLQVHFSMQELTPSPKCKFHITTPGHLFTNTR